MSPKSIAGLFVLLGTVFANPAFANESIELRLEAEDVRFRNGDLTLAGLWFTPPGDGPFPAAVFIRGSGPSTRQNYWPRAIINVLLTEGVAVLLPDKRGSDHSEGDWRSAGFDDLAGDARAAVGFVSARADVQRNMVGLVGLSQGGRIGPIAAAGSDDVAFLINVSGSAVTATEQISWEMFHTFREAGLAGRSLQEALHLQVTAESYVRGELSWARYMAIRDRGLKSSWAKTAAGFPDSADSWRWDFFRRDFEFDPLPYWERIRQPVLVVYGEDDRNAPVVRSSYRLTRAFLRHEHPDWTIRIFPETGHGLWSPESAATHHPQLHGEFIQILREWIQARITKTPN